jgi:molybdopterin synthase sulfur carrier subunit
MIEVMFFGQLTDLTGTGRIEIEGAADTDQLLRQLIQKFPALSSSTYRIAVNNKMINGNTMIDFESKIALMPPFSGG